MITLDGIENFVNLKYLKVTGLGASSGGEVEESELIIHDFTGLKKLEYLELNNIGTNLSDELDLSGLANLTELILINDKPHYDVYTGENLYLPINYTDLKLEGTLV